jgi:hypothetical protein
MKPLVMGRYDKLTITVTLDVLASAIAADREGEIKSAAKRASRLVKTQLALTSVRIR